MNLKKIKNSQSLALASSFIITILNFIIIPSVESFALGANSFSQSPGNVNFYAALSQNFKASNERIKYDIVLNNHGNSYNATTGLFLAPTNGIYFFQTNSLRYRSDQLYIHIMHNKAMVSSAANLDKNFESVSASVILELKKGDRVWVKLRVGQVYGHSPSNYSNFMGYRISDLNKIN